MIDAAPRRVGEDHAERGVVRRGDTLNPVFAPANGDADIETAHGAVLDRHAGVAGDVGDAEVANSFVEAGPGRYAVAADRVAVQVERDVVRTDHDPVARAAGEIAVERCVRSNDRAAAQLGNRRGRGSRADRGHDRECRDHGARESARPVQQTVQRLSFRVDYRVLLRTRRWRGDAAAVSRQRTRRKVTTQASLITLLWLAPCSVSRSTTTTPRCSTSKWPAEIRRAIADGEAKPGERLPPAKDLAAVLGVNTNTVLRALRELRDEGLLEFRRGRGITVAGTPEQGAVIARAHELVSFARQHGYQPDELIRIIHDLA